MQPLATSLLQAQVRLVFSNLDFVPFINTLQKNNIFLECIILHIFNAIQNKELCTHVQTGFLRGVRKRGEYTPSNRDKNTSYTYRLHLE